MRRSGLALLALALCAGACRSRVPGTLGAVSVKALDIPMTVVARDAEGRACGSDTQQNIPDAVADALAKNPEANALVNISLFKEPRCIRVRGMAVRTHASPPPPAPEPADVEVPPDQSARR